MEFMTIVLLLSLILFIWAILKKKIWANCAMYPISFSLFSSSYKLYSLKSSDAGIVFLCGLLLLYCAIRATVEVVRKK